MATGSPKNHYQQNIFPVPQSVVTFHTFSYSQPEWNQNNLKWWVWGCWCMPAQQWQPSNILGRVDRGSSRFKCAFYESDQALDPAFLPSSTTDYSNYWLMMISLSLSIFLHQKFHCRLERKEEKKVSWWKLNGNWYISTNCFSFDKSAFSHEKQCQNLSTSSNSNQINSGMNASRKFLLNTSCLSKGKLFLP